MRPSLESRKAALLVALTLPLLLFGTPHPATAQTLPEGFSALDVSGQLGSNVDAFALLPDQRIIIGNQVTGEVQLVVDGQVRSGPLLKVPNILWSGEQGLLGIAIDPDFPDSNYVYLFHTRTDSVNRVSRYTLEGDLQDPHSTELSIDPESDRTIIDLPDTRQYHNGGTLRFGKDKKLYVSSGEDNLFEVAQDLTSPLGKILRMNRDGSVPTDNPAFDPEPDGRMGQVFAMGLRNPFRFAIDPRTGELFIGDVGPEDVEELNLSRGGENFGWPRYVADQIWRDTAKLTTSDSTFPIYSYPHTGGRRAVIALATYRQVEALNGSSFPPEYDGVHFFADFFGGPIQYLRRDEGDNWTVVDFASGFSRPVDAALGPNGAMFVLEYGKAIRKIVYTGVGVGTETDRQIPDNILALRQNYPNPFDASTRFTYELGQSGRTVVSVMDALGRRVVTLRDRMEQPGLYTIEWDGRGGDGRPVTPGAYLYRVRSGGATRSRMMLVAR